MKSIFTIAILFSLFLIGCKENSQTTNATSQNTSGRVLFSFDKANAPSDVRTLTAILSRSNFTSKLKVVNIQQDTGNIMMFDQVEIGTWLIQVEAKNDSGKILYAGKSEVTVYENFVSQINLILSPVNTGIGSVQINVSWGLSEYNNWIEYEANPILSKPSDILMTSGIYLPKVIYDGDKYYMWYNMSTSQGGVGIATSTDGKQWQHQSKSSVIAIGQKGAWDGTAVGIGAIIKDQGKFKMYFNAFDQNQRFRIGYAFSTDGINWQKSPNPVFEGDTSWNYSTVSSAIIKRDSVYYLYYSARAINSSAYTIGVAYSYDGETFKKYSNKPILTATQGWEAASIYWPSIIKDGNQYIMVYMNGAGGGQSAFGIAKSNDGLQWQKNTNNPIYSWQNFHKAWSQSEIAYPFLLKLANETRLYYAGYSLQGYTIGFAVKK